MASQWQWLPVSSPRPSPASACSSLRRIQEQLDAEDMRLRRPIIDDG
jgi:hypothetical protein